MRHLFITAMAVVAALSASAQTSGSSRSASERREVITIDKARNDAREVIDLNETSKDYSTIKINGKKITPLVKFVNSAIVYLCRNSGKVDEPKIK